MKRFYTGIVTCILLLTLTQISPVLAQRDEEVLAKVGNEVITRLDFETRLKSIPSGRRQEFKNFERKKELLDTMIKARLLVVEGTDKGMMEKPDFQAKLRAIRDDFITQEYVRAYIEKKAEVTEEETKAYYESSPEFRERDLVKMSQIVVEKEEEAREILKSLKQGENFKKMAREKSLDPVSKFSGGEIEWFEKGQGEKEFEEALSKLEKGGISDIIKAKGNYYILKLDERKNVPQPPYLKVKDEILKKLKHKKLVELVEAEVEGLKKKITVETFYDKLKTEK